MTDSPVRFARVLHRGSPSYAAIDAHGGARLLGGAPWAGGTENGVQLSVEELGDGSSALLCPVQPSKIIGIGRNYRKHAEELKNEVPEEPLMFFKPPSSLLGPEGVVVLPNESSRVDYEGELVVVIGQRCRRISKADASHVVFGYTIACDVTARDLQTKDKQWTRAKGFDTFCPIGPHVIPLEDVSSLAVRLRVNGALKQDGTTSDMLFDVPSLIAYASQCMTLEPGDVILTGTPEGVGPLAPGDRVSVSIDALGELAFSVAGAS